jgi:hypothetical protein
MKRRALIEAIKRRGPSDLSGYPGDRDWDRDWDEDTEGRRWL